jgi:hypothetical protein
MNKAVFLLLLPLSLSAQVTLTPMEVRRANVLLDDCERVTDELADTRLELRRWQDAFTASESARLLAEQQIADGANLSDLHREREMVLVNALAKSGRVTKRRERLLWIVGTVAVIEAAVIGVAYGLKP